VPAGLLVRCCRVSRVAGASCSTGNIFRGGCRHRLRGGRGCLPVRDAGSRAARHPDLGLYPRGPRPIAEKKNRNAPARSPRFWHTAPRARVRGGRPLPRLRESCGATTVGAPQMTAVRWDGVSGCRCEEDRVGRRMEGGGPSSPPSTAGHMLRQANESLVEAPRVRSRARAHAHPGKKKPVAPCVDRSRGHPGRELIGGPESGGFVVMPAEARLSGEGRALIGMERKKEKKEEKGKEERLSLQCTGFRAGSPGRGATRGTSGPSPPWADRPGRARGRLGVHARRFVDLDQTSAVRGRPAGETAPRGWLALTYAGPSLTRTRTTLGEYGARLPRAAGSPRHGRWGAGFRTSVPSSQRWG